MSEPNLPPEPLSPAHSLPPQPPPFYPPSFGMTLGQALERVSRLLRANLRPFIAIGAYPFAIFIALESLVFGVLFLAGLLPHLPPTPGSVPQYSASTLWAFGGAYILFLPIFALMYGLYYGASTWAALQSDNGLAFTAAQAYRHSWSRIGRYTWLLILRSLIIAAPMIVLVIVCGIAALALGITAATSNNSPTAFLLLIPLFALGYLGFLVWAVLMSLRLSLAFPACVHEEITTGQALRRSGILTRGAKGRIFLALLVIYAIAFIALLVLELVGFIFFAIFAAVSAGSANHVSLLAIAMIAIVCLAVSVFLLVWTAMLMAAYSITFAVFYRDQCFRQNPPAFAPPPAASTL